MSRKFVKISEKDLQSKIEEIMIDADYDGREYYSINRLIEYLGDDINVEFDTENWEMFPFSKDTKYLGIHTLENGLTYCGFSVGGDWEFGIFFLVYWDGKKIRGYIPKEGNTWNTDTNICYGNNNEADLKNYNKRYPENQYEGDADDFHGFMCLDWNEMLVDINKRLVLRDETEEVVPQGLRFRIESLVFYHPNNECGELFFEICRLCKEASETNRHDVAEKLYEWAKELADDSKQFAIDEMNGDLSEFAYGEW